MNTHDMIVALLGIWSELPALVGEAWPAGKQQLLDLLAAYQRETDQERRAAIGINLLRKLRDWPSVMPVFRKTLETVPIRREPTRGFSSDSNDQLPTSDAEVEAALSALLAAERAATPEQATRSETTDRAINAWVEGLAADEPLDLGTTYGLLFDVGPRRGESRVTELFVYRFWPGEQRVEVQVLIETDDFIVRGDDQQTLQVPRVGPSLNQARFDIEPKRRGEAVIKAFLIAHNRVFQKLTLTFQVGPVSDLRDVFGFAAVGIALEAAIQRPARAGLPPINLMIVQQSSGYQFILQGGGVRRAFLRVSVEEIDGWLKYARGVLHNIVHLQDADGNYLYQAENTTIAPDICASSLKQLAAAGIYLFDELFYGSSGPDARAIGDLLKELSRQRQLKIQIVAEKFFFPWLLLYDGDDPDNPDPKEFWGFKHIIEYLPEFSAGTPVNFIPTIEAGDMLDMAFVCNDAIDTQFGRPIVQGQRETFHRLPGVNVKDYPTVQHLVDLMKDPNAPPLIYFYCHAVSKFPNEEGGVDDSKIALTDTRIALRELKIKARTALPPLARAPLIFLNACESAELSPYLYDGLVPYMIARGVRGVIGTEVETPALFAAEFAKEFMRRFTVGGQPLGELLLDMRREYLEQKNNVMGLVYALYSSGDIVVRRDGRR